MYRPTGEQTDGPLAKIGGGQVLWMSVDLGRRRGDPPPSPNPHRSVAEAVDVLFRIEPERAVETQHAAPPAA